MPITLGQEYNGYISFFKRYKEHIKQVTEDCLTISLDVTAIGIELGEKSVYVNRVYAHLSEIVG